jgi:hypothetical protein
MECSTPEMFFFGELTDFCGILWMIVEEMGEEIEVLVAALFLVEKAGLSKFTTPDFSIKKHAMKCARKKKRQSTHTHHHTTTTTLLHTLHTAQPLLFLF